jgi:hypothetical protein
MEELSALRAALEQHRYADALALVGELEEMSKDDKIEKIYSFMVILLIHLIKQHAEQRSTRSWDLSIRESVKRIRRTNRRRKAGGYYLNEAELRENLDDAWDSAIAAAALEAFEGRYEAEELASMVDRQRVLEEALGMMSAT